MKRTLTLTGAGLAAAGLVLALVPALPAAADVTPCAQMGGNVTILNTPTPTCTLLYTSGGSSIVLPADGPRLVYGVVNMTGSSVPTTFTDRKGKVWPLNATEGKRWLSVGPTKAAQTIVRAEIVNNKIGKTFPQLFITDDAITDRFAGKTFIAKTNNAKGSKNKISIWTRIDWAQGLSDNGGLRGVIANYKQNVLEAGQCKPAMTKQHADMVKQRFGQKGKLDLSWNPGLSKSDGGSSLIMDTETTAEFARPAPTALELTQRVWKPGKINFTLVGSDSGLMKILVNDVRAGSAVTKCSLKP
ncbi:MAG: hypothetical protein RL134_713 [Actinomycetota bacterium]|jgi:hypothetical protein